MWLSPGRKRSPISSSPRVKSWTHGHPVYGHWACIVKSLQRHGVRLPAGSWTTLWPIFTTNRDEIGPGFVQGSGSKYIRPISGRSSFTCHINMSVSDPIGTGMYGLRLKAPNSICELPIIGLTRHFYGCRHFQVRSQCQYYLVVLWYYRERFTRSFLQTPPLPRNRAWWFPPRRKHVKTF